MRVVIADTSPLHYLVLIGAIDLLPRLFTHVVAPVEVRDELRAAKAQAAVRLWAETFPPWFTVQQAPPIDGDVQLQKLDAGERGAIALAITLRPDLILLDDHADVAVARARGFAVTGTLGVLDSATKLGLIDLPAAVAALQATNFHARQELIDALLAGHEPGRGATTHNEPGD